LQKRHEYVKVIIRMFQNNSKIWFHIHQLLPIFCELANVIWYRPHPVPHNLRLSTSLLVVW